MRFSWSSWCIYWSQSGTNGLCSSEVKATAKWLNSKQPFHRQTMHINKGSASRGISQWESEVERTTRVHCGFLMDVKCFFVFFNVITGFRQPINLPVTSSLQSSNAQATSLDWKVMHCFRLVDSYYCLQGLASSTCSVWQLWHVAASLYPGGPVVILLCLIYNFPSVGLTKSLYYYFFLLFFLSSFLLLKKIRTLFSFYPNEKLIKANKRASVKRACLHTGSSVQDLS